MDRIKNFFGICSPSTLFAEIGGNLGEGIGAGFEKAMDYVSDGMQDVIPADFDMPGVFGGSPGEIMQDKEGVSVLRNLGQNMAWLIRMREATKDTIAPPSPYKRARTNFIR